MNLTTPGLIHELAGGVYTGRFVVRAFPWKKKEDEELVNRPGMGFVSPGVRHHQPSSHAHLSEQTRLKHI